MGPDIAGPRVYRWLLRRYFRRKSRCRLPRFSLTPFLLSYRIGSVARFTVFACLAESARCLSRST